MIEKYLYLCDQKKCKDCSYPECKHTDNINHAKNKKGHVFKPDKDISKNRITYWEVEGEGEE